MTTLPDTLEMQSQELASRVEQGQEGASQVNVGMAERLITGAAGAALVLVGLKRTVPGLLVGAIGGALAYRAFSGYCPGYQAIGVNTASRNPPEPEEYFERGIHVEQSYTINKPAEELYGFWKNLENLPRFMRHLERVEKLDEKRSHWVAKGPAGMSVEWDAEIINDEPNALIAWRSLEGATVHNAGSIRFVPAPADRGTEVKVVIDYIPPAGTVGWAVAKLFGREPKQEIREDLRHFKQFIEAGEIPTIEGQPKGNCRGM